MPLSLTLMALCSRLYVIIKEKLLKTFVAQMNQPTSVETSMTVNELYKMDKLPDNFLLTENYVAPNIMDSFSQVSKDIDIKKSLNNDNDEIDAIFSKVYSKNKKRKI